MFNTGSVNIRYHADNYIRYQDYFTLYETDNLICMCNYNYNCDILSFLKSPPISTPSSFIKSAFFLEVHEKYHCLS